MSCLSYHWIHSDLVLFAKDRLIGTEKDTIKWEITTDRLSEISLVIMRGMKFFTYGD